MLCVLVYTLLKLVTGTIQLSSTVTFAHVSDASRTHPECIPYAFCMHLRLEKSSMALTYVLSQVFVLAWTDLARVLDTFQVRLTRVSDAFKCYLGAEWYVLVKT